MSEPAPGTLPAPPPPPGPFYRVVQVRANLSEQTLQDFPYTDGNLADEQARRAEAAAFARAKRDNEGMRVRIYSSDAQGKIGAGDLVADSTVNV